MSKDPLLPVSEALARILATAALPLPAETVPLHEAHRRTLAENLVAPRNQPPFPPPPWMVMRSARPMSRRTPVTLRLIGTSAAGHAFEGAVGPGEAVRIFTGAPIPPGADTIVIQEDAAAGERRRHPSRARKRGGTFGRPASISPRRRF